MSSTWPSVSSPRSVAEPEDALDAEVIAEPLSLVVFA
jgi:hypothetical protein